MLTTFYAPILKIDKQADGTIKIHGIASSEAVDRAGEVIKSDAISGALPDFFMHGTGALREMHQPIAAGTIDDAFITDGSTYVTATVVDKAAIDKVLKGVYKGLSIGGRVIERDSKNRKIITKISLAEISLVDMPCNPDAVFNIWKSADSEEIMKDPENKADDTIVESVEVVVTEPIDKVAEELSVVETTTELVEKTAEEVVAEEPVDPVAKADALLSAIEASEVPAVVEEVQKSADEIIAELTAKVADLEKLVEEKTVEKAAADEQIESLTKAASEKEEALTGKGESLTKLADRTSVALEVLTKRLDDRDAQIDVLTKRLEEVALMPVPARTVGPGANFVSVVEKGADAAGGASAGNRQELSEEEVHKVLASMSPEDRAMAMIKSTLKFPRQISVR